MANSTQMQSTIRFRRIGRNTPQCPARLSLALSYYSQWAICTLPAFLYQNGNAEA
jgi:hypothetical protein